MMRRALIPLLLASVSSTAVAAEPARNSSQLRALQAIKSEKSAPSEIRFVSYSAAKRTEITGVIGEPVTVTFPREESVYRIVQTSKPNGQGGLTDAGWYSPQQEKDKPPIVLGNQLPLWPLATGTTSLTVTTCIPDDQEGRCKYGTQKPYYFLLTAIPRDDAASNPNVTVGLIFKGGAGPAAVVAAPTSINHLMSVTGDESPAPRRQTPKRKRRDDAELAEVQERLRTDSFNTASGCHYSAKGPQGSSITPLCPMDNQIWTLFRFPGLSQKPAIYVTDPTQLCGAEAGKYERLTRQGAADDFVVVQEIAQRFCLRLGSNVLQVDNLAYNAAGNPTGTGTIAPSVKRVILKAAK